MSEIVEEARRLLGLLGFDRERANERSAMTLLALLHLRPGDSWSQAQAPMLGTRAIMDWIAKHYGQAYAPNTRETIRRFTLHQFAAALLVEQNPDAPDRPVNSPKWCYQVHTRALDVIRVFGTVDFPTRWRRTSPNAPASKPRTTVPVRCGVSQSRSPAVGCSRSARAGRTP